MNYRLQPLWISMANRPIAWCVWSFIAMAVVLFPVMAWMGGPN